MLFLSQINHPVRQCMHKNESTRYHYPVEMLNIYQSFVQSEYFSTLKRKKAIMNQTRNERKAEMK